MVLVISAPACLFFGAASLLKKAGALVRARGLQWRGGPTRFQDSAQKRPNSRK
jgi:hypothetical protein